MTPMLSNPNSGKTKARLSEVHESWLKNSKRVFLAVTATVMATHSPHHEGQHIYMEVIHAPHLVEAANLAAEKKR